MVNWSLVVPPVCFIWNCHITASPYILQPIRCSQQLSPWVMSLWTAQRFSSGLLHFADRISDDNNSPRSQTCNEQLKTVGWFTDWLILKPFQDWLARRWSWHHIPTQWRNLFHLNERKFAIWPLDGGAYPNVQCIESNKIVMSMLTRILD